MQSWRMRGRVVSVLEGLQALSASISQTATLAMLRGVLMAGIAYGRDALSRSVYEWLFWVARTSRTRSTFSSVATLS